MSMLRVSRFALQVLYSTSSNLPAALTFGGGTSLTDRAANASNPQFEAFRDTVTLLDKPKTTRLEYSLDPSSPTGLRRLDFHRISGSNTREIDDFRQGVEITSEFYRGLGTSPKIWAGNAKGITSVTTLGQGASFTEVQNNKAWTDKARFDPVVYIGSPIGFNAFGEPINISEAPLGDRGKGIQTLGPVSGNKPSDFFHGVRGNVDDGNPVFDVQNGSNSRISQFINFREAIGGFPFSDDNINTVGFGLQPHLVLAQDPLARVYMRLESTIEDWTGNQNMVIDGGVATFSDSDPAVRPGGVPAEVDASSFVGLRDSAVYISGTTNDSSLNGTDFPVSAECLFYPSSSMSVDMAAEVRPIFWYGEGDTSTSAFSILYKPSADELIYQGKGGSTDDIRGTAGFAYDTWYHVAMNRDANGTVKLYVNGAQIASSSDFTPDGAFPGGTGSHRLYVFGIPAAPIGMGGRISNLQILSRSLTDGEVLTNAKQFTAVFPFNIVAITEGSRSIDNRVVAPFDDIGNEKLVTKIAASGDLLSFLKSSGSFNLDNDIRQIHDVKSATAGTDVYGSNQAQYGTDSIAYAGYYRGS